MNVRLKRLLAFIIDWYLIWLPVFLMCMAMGLSTKELMELPWWFVFVMFSLVMLAFGVMVLRDWLLRGRSLGKRIFKLYVYNSQTVERAALNRCALRNIFFFLYPIDGVFLLTTGRTIGDRVANTIVLAEKDVQAYKEKQSARKPKKSKKQKILLICGIVIAVYIVFLGSLQIVLTTKKNDPAYQAAYQYMVESDAFHKLNKEESRIRLKHYYKQGLAETPHGTFDIKVSIGINGEFRGDKDCVYIEEFRQVTQFSFGIGLRTFRVVCHNEAGKWQVCSVCTQFR